DATGALAILGPVLEVEERVRPSPHPRRGETLLLRGRALLLLGDRAGAREALSAADREFAELPGSHPLRRELRDADGAG
ncbi:MAG TPA: hypothetical protein VLA43_05035, partial [Longimicrobiales bacterium]|nr:hypothetical protein [Longimicrobiales bacterium]